MSRIFVSIVHVCSKIQNITQQTFVSACQYVDLSTCFFPGEKKRMSSRSVVKPQYVHHLSPEPPPEVSEIIPKQKGKASWLVIITSISSLNFIASKFYSGANFILTQSETGIVTNDTWLRPLIITPPSFWYKLFYWSLAGQIKKLKALCACSPHGGSKYH